MPARLRPLLWALACSSATLGIGLLLPLWHRWATVDHSVCPETVPVWQGLTDRRPVPPGEAYYTRDANRTNCLILIAIAGSVGTVVFWRCQPRARPTEAPDYSDGAGGALPDGRA